MNAPLIIRLDAEAVAKVILAWLDAPSTTGDVSVEAAGIGSSRRAQGLIDPDDLAALRRRAAMATPVLLWRDHTAAVLSTLIAACDEQEEPSKALLDAAASAREVLTADPEKAYMAQGFDAEVSRGVSGLRTIHRLRHDLATAGRQIATLTAERDGARFTAMNARHAQRINEAALSGKLAAARLERDQVRTELGVTVAELAEVRRQRDKAEQIVSDRGEALDRAEAESTRWKTRLVDETARLRTHLAKARAERPRVWWPGDEQPEGVIRVTTVTERGDVIALCGDGLWRDPNSPNAPGAGWTGMLAEEGPVIEVVEGASA